MQAHVNAVASGFGFRIIPVAPPYEFTLDAEPAQLVVLRRTAHGELSARVTPDAGGYTSKVDVATAALADVVDVVRGPTLNSWWIETTVYMVPLPRGWKAVVSGDARAPSAFDLFGPNDAMMFVQTPSVVPQLEQLCVPGQQVHACGADARSDWVELRYSHDGRTWVQRHDLVNVGRITCALTVQSPLASFTAIAPAHQAVLTSIAPGGSPGT